MFTKPQAEHAWFNKLIGEWIVESECKCPDQPIVKMKGEMVCRTLGGLWTIFECELKSTNGNPWKTIMTLGYDPETKKYTGTFIDSTMTHLWIYSGSMDESGKKLVLDSEGPNFDNSGKAKYQDILEVDNDNHWIFSSQTVGEDGNWQSILMSHNIRKQ